jgi:ATP-dependent Lhr-like helicase
VTNDRFDPLRPGAFEMLDALASATGSRHGRSRSPRSRAGMGTPVGRWTRLEVNDRPAEAHASDWIDALLDRYGVLTRELVQHDPWSPPWSELYPWLARRELRGELRRGFFVEGFSGVQYATDEAAEELARLAATTDPAREDVMLAAGDPANLYGSGAPLDIPLLEGGTARLSRLAGNFLVIRGGRPILVIEANGKRLTGLASAAQHELDEALTHLITLAPSQRNILKIETYNGQPAISSPIAARLASLGFVRDFPAMTYYAAWGRTTPAQSPAGHGSPAS